MCVNVVSACRSSSIPDGVEMIGSFGVCQVILWKKHAAERSMIFTAAVLNLKSEVCLTADFSLKETNIVH